MKEYFFACKIGGTEKWLQILGDSSGLYQVFWDAKFIGTVEPMIDDELGIKWSTDYGILKPHVYEIGKHIVSSDS